MFGIPLEAAIQGVAGIADGHIANQGISKEIHRRRQPQRGHGIHWQASREEIDTGKNSNGNNQQSQLPAKIFLDIERVMTARYTGGNDTAIDDGGIHEDFNRLLAMGTHNPAGF